ncbi:MAG: hypothetical protein AB7G24_01470 [Novosphingobium sp.]
MSGKVATETASVALSYDGLQASEHRIDMRRFGYAIVGLDHVVTHGVIALTERRIARPRERLEFDVVVGEPREGSVEILGALMAAYQGTQGNLPFLIQIINDAFPDVLWHWLSWVFKSLGGREKEADPHFVKLMEFSAKIHSDEKIDRERERQFLLQVLDRLAPHASAVAVPVGESSNVMRLRVPGTGQETEIGVPEAAAIRSKEPLEVGDPRIMRIRIDGLTKHTNRGSVELPDEPGRYFPAEIRDPLFEQTPNPYISAMNSSEEIHVNAVPSYRAGELFRIYIMGLAARAA